MALDNKSLMRTRKLPIKSVKNAMSATTASIFQENPVIRIYRIPAHQVSHRLQPNNGILHPSYGIVGYIFFQTNLLKLSIPPDRSTQNTMTVAINRRFMICIISF